MGKKYKKIYIWENSTKKKYGEKSKEKKPGKK